MQGMVVPLFTGTPKDVFGSEVTGPLIDLHRFEGESCLHPRGYLRTLYKEMAEQKGGTPQTREKHVAILLMVEDRKMPPAVIVVWVQCS